MKYSKIGSLAYSLDIVMDKISQVIYHLVYLFYYLVCLIFAFQVDERKIELRIRASLISLYRSKAYWKYFLVLPLSFDLEGTEWKSLHAELHPHMGNLVRPSFKIKKAWGLVECKGALGKNFYSIKQKEKQKTPIPTVLSEQNSREIKERVKVHWYLMILASTLQCGLTLHLSLISTCPFLE